MELPIDVVPGVYPARFRWKQRVDSIVGMRLVEHTGSLNPHLGSAISSLISLCKQLMTENIELRQQVSGIGDKVKVHDTVTVTDKGIGTPQRKAAK